MSDFKYPLASSSWGQAEYEAIDRVVKSGFFKMGRECSLFEKKFAEWIGSEFAIFCNSGSSANLLAVAALKYDPRKKGDNRNVVIVPTVSWSTTYSPLMQLGYELRFVDVSSDDFNVNCDLVKEVIDDDVCGIMAVNLLGAPSDLVTLQKLCRDHSLWMIEDNCEAMGASIENKKTGTYGTIGTHSTFFSHHISTMEGGICVTNDPLLFEIMKSLRAHGWTRDVTEDVFYDYFDKQSDSFLEKFHFVLPGFNVRPTELQGAIGIAQLAKLDEFLRHRENNLNTIRSIIESNPNVRLQAVRNGARSSWFGFGLLFDSSELRSRFIKSAGLYKVEVRPIVGGDITMQPMIKFKKTTEGEFPVAGLIHRTGLMLGNHQYPLDYEFEILEHVLAH